MSGLNPNGRASSGALASSVSVATPPLRQFLNLIATHPRHQRQVVVVAPPAIAGAFPIAHLAVAAFVRIRCVRAGAGEKTRAETPVVREVVAGEEAPFLAAAERDVHSFGHRAALQPGQVL